MGDAHRHTRKKGAKKENVKKEGQSEGSTHLGVKRESWEEEGHTSTDEGIRFPNSGGGAQVLKLGEKGGGKPHWDRRLWHSLKRAGVILEE